MARPQRPVDGHAGLWCVDDYHGHSSIGTVNLGFDIALSIQAWGAWAPGLESAQAWQDWATADSAVMPALETAPTLPQVPPMLRRRLDQLGRVALQAAFDAADGAATLPTIFVSRRGDAPRSFELLQTLIAGEGLSPTAFGLSVHNAIAAQFSMVRADRSFYTALAAGTGGIENALVEAAGWLADGHAEILLVAFETRIPDAFSGFRDEPDPLFAWAWRLAPPGSGGRSLRLHGSVATADAQGLDASDVPAALAPMRHFLRGTQRWHSGIDGVVWNWALDD